MDRDKKASLLKNRGPVPSGSKNKPLFNSADLIMLGPKQIDKTAGKGLGSASSSLDRKPAGSAVPAKKPKLAGPSGQTASTPALPKFSSVVKRDLMAGSGGTRRDSWEAKAVAVDSDTLMAKFVAAERDADEERMQGVLCGAVKLLRTQRPKPEVMLYLSLMFLAKTRPQAFQNDVVVEALCHLLRKETPPSPALKVKGSSSVAILAANLLLASYQDCENWPDVLVRVFVEDSLGDRLWVDHDECRCFVDNLLTAFHTRLPPKSMMAPELTFKTQEAVPSPPASVSGGSIAEDDDSLSSLHLDLKETSAATLSVVPRYSTQEERIERYILDVIQEQLQRRQPTDISRNVLRLMVCACGLSAVRALVAHRLETWLSNPKLTRPAQDLLLTTCMNCNQHNKHDQDVIEYLVRIRLKTKPVINHFLQCVRELLGLHPDNLPSMLRRTIFNELSQSRNPNNMALISVILQHSPERAAKILAEIFQDLLASRDDFLRALRALFREIIRSLRHELNFHAFCVGLTSERKDPHIVGLDQVLKERLLMQIADLITLAAFMAITPAVKDSATALYRGEKKDLLPLYNFQQQVSAIQCNVVGWMYTVVIRMYRPNYQDFMHVLRKCLFLLDQPEHYWRDNWPPEPERALCLRIASEMPVMEDTLLRILFIGMSKEHPGTAGDAIDIADALVRRAAAVATIEGVAAAQGGIGRPPALQVEQAELFDIIFSLCAYYAPDTYALPEGYEPPSLAIADYYWRALLLLLVVVAHNPVSCGRAAWLEYPTLRSMMQMCITNSFVFVTPPASQLLPAVSGDHLSVPSAGSASVSDTGTAAGAIQGQRPTELQIALQEKQRILEFETHLAAASTKVTITEQNSLLLSKLITMLPRGPARRPPPAVLDQLKQLNEKLKLGHLLCRSRDPDYLLEIIRDQQQLHAVNNSGTSFSVSGGVGGTGPQPQQQQQPALQQPSSMPWLAELVESSEGSLDILPVQCLCEFLLLSDSTIGRTDSAANTAANAAVSDSVPAPAQPYQPQFPQLQLRSGQHPARTGAIVGVPQPKRQKLQQLIAHLQRLLRDTDPEQRDTAREVIDYFMKRLTSQHSSPRELAMRALNQLLCHHQLSVASSGAAAGTNIASAAPNATASSSLLSGIAPTPFSSNASCASASQSALQGNDVLVLDESESDFDWLLEQIPQLPHFNYLLDQVIVTLRSAIHIETDPYTVVAYVVFLSQHTPTEQQAEVCLDLAHLLVERATIVNAILPQDSCGTSAIANQASFPYGDLFLGALLDLFLVYINFARQANVAAPHTAGEWLDEYVQVEWSTGEHAQLHILVVHSMIIALTYGPPHNEHYDQFGELLRIWFPQDGSALRAFLTTADDQPGSTENRREEAQLLPDWLKLRMIRSPVELLVEAALCDLSAEQLVLFIQSFGIPVASMSKLLNCLDRAVDQDPHSLSNAMLDKAYMSQLVEVQHKRGAVGGDKYKRLLSIDRDQDGGASMEGQDIAQPSAATAESAALDSTLVPAAASLCAAAAGSGTPTSVIQATPRLQPCPSENALQQQQQQQQQAECTAWQSVGDTLLRIYRPEVSECGFVGFQQEQILYRRLQKLLAGEMAKTTVAGSPVHEFICCCEQLLETTEKAQQFVEQLQRKVAMSCSLFRLAIAATRNEALDSDVLSKLFTVCNMLVKMLNNDASYRTRCAPLLGIFRQYISRISKKRTAFLSAKRATVKQSEPAIAAASADEIMLSLRTIATACPDRLEEAMCTLAQKAIRSGDSYEVCKAVTKLLSNEHLLTSGKSDKGPIGVNTSFVLVDWFEQLEPECVWTDKASQICLLFEKYSQNSKINSSRFRLYLLSVLIHRAHWATLRDCINMLLVCPIDTKFDATNVLDFLSACMFIPKIWQGRDKKLPKHHKIENVLALSADQMCAVTDYMLEEIFSVVKAHAGENYMSETNSAEIIRKRMHIIEHSFLKQADITFLADHLVTTANSDGGFRSTAAKCLLVELYLSMPSIIFSAAPVSYLLSDINPQKRGYTRVDCLSHSILTAMAVCDTDKDLKSDLRYLNLSCRKLAATHPDLLLRQLPLISGLLHSRLSAGIPMFGTKNNRKSFFVCIIGIFELVRDKFFHHEYSTHVNAIFSVYLESILMHVNAGMPRTIEDNVSSNLNRVLNLVNSYIRYNPDAAREFLADHHEQLEELSRTYRNMASLRALLKGGIFMQQQHQQNQQNQEEKSMGVAGSGNAGSGTPPPTGGSPHIDSSTTTALAASDETLPQHCQQPYYYQYHHVPTVPNKIPLNLSDRDATLQSLQKLEAVASRRPAILDLYHDDLQTILAAGDSQLCKQAFRLMLLTIEQRPSAAGRFISCYLQCLASERRDVVAMALEKLPDFVVLCEEYAPLLLHKAFQLGISSNVNSVEHISDALELLNMQYGN